MKPTICLAMIARNEAPNIARTLESVKPYIDHWIVADTGSIDNTCVIARSVMSPLPGKVVHHVWQDFGHNRSLALAAAAKSGCDFTLVLDADELLVLDDPHALDDLPFDAYRLEMRFPTLSYPTVRLLRSNRSWRYEGRIHEYPRCDPPAEEYLLDPSRIHLWTDGNGARGRSGTKAEGDLTVLEQAVIDEPRNPRYWFYLAQTREMCGKKQAAIAAYAIRSDMGDYYEEVWYSYYRIAQLQMLEGNWEAARRYYLNAYQHSPSRAEPLYWLALAHHNRQEDHLAALYLEQATCIDKPLSAFFVEEAVYDYLRWIHYAVCLHNTGKSEEAREMAIMLVRQRKIPEKYQAVIERLAGGETVAAPVAAHG